MPRESEGAASLTCRLARCTSIVACGMAGQCQPLALADVGSRATAWRAAKGYGLSAELIVAKLCEEAGEVARAVIADIERRPGRGDAVQEAAQVVILLASLLHHHYEANVFDAVLAEMERAGA